MVNKTECDKWLDTLTDAQLDDRSPRSLANEAWNHGAFMAYNQAIEDAKAAIRGESVDDPYAAPTFINALARKCSPHVYVNRLSPASAAPVVNEPLLPQTNYKNKPQLDGKKRYEYGHLFHEYTFNNCDHGEQSGRVCKGCVVECLAYLDQRAAATAAPQVDANTCKRAFPCRYRDARQCALDTMLGSECPKVCECSCHATAAPVEQKDGR